MLQASSALIDYTPPAYVTLLRPANVITAFADVLAGFAIAGLQNHRALPWLLAAGACLYAGGVVLNDVFDRELDRVERPERPIPSGRVRPGAAATLGGLLLAAGVLAAAQATLAALSIAILIAVLVLLYDGWAKRHPVLGPANMALCRACNLLLGIAAVPAALGEQWPIAAIPFLYIAGVTALSRGEVYGGGTGAATFALVSLSAALSGLAVVALRSGQALVAGIVLASLVWRVMPPFVEARRVPEPTRIRHAVKRGVLSLVLVNAVIGTAYAGPWYGALILVTAVAAGLLARLFPVT
jgi:4-hydroxybenzoate polyprenyltransferase